MSQAEIDTMALLRLTLEELFNKTAVDCATKMMEHWESPSEVDASGSSYLSHGGEPIIGAAISDLRHKSLECTTNGFHQLLEGMPIPQLSSKAARDRAAELTWEAIDEVYGWRDGRLKTGRFREWFVNAQAMGDRCEPMDFDVPLMHAACKLNKRTYVQTSCDFRRMFENRIAALRLGTLYGAGLPDAQPPSAAEDIPATATASADRWYYHKDLIATNRAISTPARGRLVTNIKQELEQYRPDLADLRSNFQKLTKDYPGCIAFDIYARATLKRRHKFDVCIAGRRNADLAYELAADAAGKGAATMKKAWIDYNKTLRDGG